MAARIVLCLREVARRVFIARVSTSVALADRPRATVTLRHEALAC